ncbi:MAG TPA: serine/threonine-protein kinase [Planctomycetota bacterium]|nr:serine/threonine-protein kinase [Planctomycetota bacterium]
MFDFPGYTINSKLAEGACAEIYAGVEQSTGRQVAIKILHRKHLANKTEYKRLQEEGALGLKLPQHDNIVQFYKAGMSGNLPYVVLEYVNGKTLREIIRNKKKLGDLDILKLTKGLARALRAVHNLNICHKDLKPDNIMISEAGVVKLLDFGFAENIKAFKLFGRSLDGSLPYLAPEMFSTKKATPQTDIYALGCTLYECAAGFQPFGGMSDAEIAQKQQNLKLMPPPIQANNPGISVFTEKMIMMALQKEVARRFKSADEILLDLARNPALRETQETQRVLKKVVG